MKKSDYPLITIDGPGATGKSTVAWEISKRLGIHFLNSGSLYRVAAYYAHENIFSLDEVENIANQLNKDKLAFTSNEVDNDYAIFLNNKNITNVIKQDSIAGLASRLSKEEILRRALVRKQQDFYSPPGLVADGRDMGSCIFPEAKYKFFLTASANIRAERRVKELQKQQINANFTEVLASLTKRDEQDATRAIAPLVIPPGALVIDTSELSFEEVVDKVLSHCCLSERC